ncbi:hypothetical protein NIES1031_01880 [Chroogloeocystis siderophila 5.2 s.c.1]|uniref:Uncharacterized protein n=1 Tax=Chroogloeocystis siderophila 5.2 s.c.1 TaxID=247279 RepID=A0A1U7HYI3_9CHRO|nr:hypothetical protein NIES1031_01880 [Chroogloeocystis siderophila 5.2 s.c.1]
MLMKQALITWRRLSVWLLSDWATLLRSQVGKRTSRISWIAALKQGKLFAPLTFAGSCNRDWFEMVVLQK